jgi:hypothetical protein
MREETAHTDATTVCLFLFQLPAHVRTAPGESMLPCASNGSINASSMSRALILQMHWHKWQQKEPEPEQVSVCFMLG